MQRNSRSECGTRMHYGVFRSGFLAVALLAGVLPSVIVGVQAAGATEVPPGWVINQAYDEPVTTIAVSCPTTSVCVSVGNAESAGGDIVGSLDGGSTWNTLTPPSGLSTLRAVSCPSASVCYAGGSGGENYSGVVIATQDGGNTWSTQETPPGGNDSPGYIDGMSCPSTTTCFAVGSQGMTFPEILGTTNSGATWNALTIPSAPGIQAIQAIGCGSSTNCVAISGGYIFTTSNGGSTWSEQSVSNALQSVSCPSPSTCVAVGKGISAETTNGGTSWTTNSAPFSEAALSVSCGSTSFCVAAGESSEMVAPTPLLEETSDGGVAWSPASVPSGVDGLTGVSCPSTHNCAAVGQSSLAGEGTVIVTSDGETWNQEFVSSGVTNLSSISCPSSSQCYAVGSALYEAPGTDGDSTLLESSDSGSTWSQESLPAGISYVGAVSCPSPSTCYVVAYGNSSYTLLATTDGGETWDEEPFSAANTESVSIDCPKADTCYVVAGASTGSLILTTLDGGATWSTYDADGNADLFSIGRPILDSRHCSRIRDRRHREHMGEPPRTTRRTVPGCRFLPLRIGLLCRRIFQ